MITEIDANLLEYPLDGFLHQANCFTTMGGGIAAQIKRKYPELYQADCDFEIPSGDQKRLGKFSWTKLHDEKIGINMYSQYDFGGFKCHTDYKAMASALMDIERFARDNNIQTLGLPKNMGCALGGGDWAIVRALLDGVFLGSKVHLYICNYP